eukprot:1137841-Pelagomonas_calceolata.AAC.5
MNMRLVVLAQEHDFNLQSTKEYISRSIVYSEYLDWEIPLAHKSPQTKVIEVNLQISKAIGEVWRDLDFPVHLILYAGWGPHINSLVWEIHSQGNSFFRSAEEFSGPPSGNNNFFSGPSGNAVIYFHLYTRILFWARSLPKALFSIWNALFRNTDYRMLHPFPLQKVMDAELITTRARSAYLAGGALEKRHGDCPPQFLRQLQGP